ncbi:macro domain-containing protein [Candidatus Bipolaricaulota bacterium]|nr:macro domain-containing protein [Candidatus Bipolaricaulota bacterium]
MRSGAPNDAAAEVFGRPVGPSRMRVVHGDLVLQDVDAIVNAANPDLSGGGGVDGAIHRAGGPEILRECQAYVREHGPLPVGGAMWTHGGRLRAHYVIHTVGPVYRCETRAAVLLSSAYRHSLETASKLGVRSIAFPSISTGAYGYPVREAAPIAVSTVVTFLRKRKHDEDLALDVRWVCLHAAAWRVFRDALAAGQARRTEGVRAG